MEFTKATKEQAKLRMALIGSSGSGKTYTSLLLSKELGKRVALIDTERGSASKYADEFSFDTLQLKHFSAQEYIDAINAAVKSGYDVLVIDSLSHAWAGIGGVLEFVDDENARQKSGNSFAAWRKATPLHNKLVDAIIQSDLHIIVTMRAKTEYVLEKDERGKNIPRKVGLAPIQRDGLEYEFDIVGDMDADNTLVVSKTRCKALAGAVIRKPDAELGKTIATWLSSGVIPEKKAESPKQVASPNVSTPKQAVEKAAQLKAEKEEPIALIAQLKVTAKAQFEKYAGKHPDDEQAKKLAAVIGHALGDKYNTEEKESLRHQIYKRIAGVEHGKELDLALAATMQTRWCQPGNHYEANDVAKNEIAQLLVAMQKENGQTAFA